MENLENCKENSEDKEHFSDSKKEVGGLKIMEKQYFTHHKMVMTIRWYIFFFYVHLLSEQQQEKLNRLEEQLDLEMQAKDELEQKCKYVCF